LTNIPKTLPRVDNHADDLIATGTVGERDDLLDTTAMSRWFGYGDQWFEIARCKEKGFGPPFLRIGGRVRYRRGDVLDWLAERKRFRSSDEYFATDKRRRGRQAGSRVVVLSPDDPLLVEIDRRQAEKKANGGEAVVDSEAGTQCPESNLNSTRPDAEPARRRRILLQRPTT
jgi:hypothetical protein